MKSLLKFALPLALTVGSASLAYAVQDKVVDVLKAPQAGTSVTLQGRLVEDLGSSSYKFRDETGEISVNITPNLIPQNALAENSTVEIVGRVETSKAEAPQVKAGMVMVTQTTLEPVQPESVTK